MMKRLGEQRWFELMLAHSKLERSVVVQHGGDVVKSQGDGFMLTFRSAGAALACAVELQRALTRSGEANHEQPMRVRIGVHTGNIFQAENDYLGRAVVLAARITGRARGGEVLISAASKKYTERLERWRYGTPSSLSLKGFTGAERVYSLDWQAADAI